MECRPTSHGRTIGGQEASTIEQNVESSEMNGSLIEMGRPPTSQECRSDEPIDPFSGQIDPSSEPSGPSWDQKGEVKNPEGPVIEQQRNV